MTMPCPVMTAEEQAQGEFLMFPGFNRQPITLSHPFLLDLSLYRHTRRNCVLVAVNFSLEHFSTDLFRYFSIDFPAQMNRAVPKRQAEFLAGRLSAKLALQQLEPRTFDTVTVGTGEHRQPLWPDQIKGSITHTKHRAICLVTNDAQIDVIGIDTEHEHSAETVTQIGAQIFNEDEFNKLRALGFSNTQSSTLLFSSKESIFKALYPQVGEYFGFECARFISGDRQSQTLTLELLGSFSKRHGLPDLINIQYVINDNSITTLIL